MSWARVYEDIWVCPAYPGTKYPVYVSPRDRKSGEVRPDPYFLHSRFKSQIDYLQQKPANEFVIRCSKEAGYTLGVITGPQRDGRFLVIFDFDGFGSSIEEGRGWRKERIPLLKAWNTRITMSPKGGFHAWFYVADPLEAEAFVRRRCAEQATDWISLLDMTRKQGGFTVEPPSK